MGGQLINWLIITKIIHAATSLIFLIFIIPRLSAKANYNSNYSKLISTDFLTSDPYKLQNFNHASQLQS